MVIQSFKVFLHGPQSLNPSKVFKNNNNNNDFYSPFSNHIPSILFHFSTHIFHSLILLYLRSPDSFFLSSSEQYHPPRHLVHPCLPLGFLIFIVYNFLVCILKLCVYFLCYLTPSIIMEKRKNKTMRESFFLYFFGQQTNLKISLFLCYSFFLFIYF